MLNLTLESIAHIRDAQFKQSKSIKLLSDLLWKQFVQRKVFKVQRAALELVSVSLYVFSPIPDPLILTNGVVS